MEIHIRSPWIIRQLTFGLKPGITVTEAGVLAFRSADLLNWDKGTIITIGTGLLCPIRAIGGEFTKPKTLGWVWVWNASECRKRINLVWKFGLLSRVEHRRGELKQLSFEALNVHSSLGRSFIPNQMVARWIELANQFSYCFPFLDQIDIDDDLLDLLGAAKRLWELGRKGIDDANAQWVREEIRRLGDDSAFKKLTQEQLEAIVTLEDSTLLVAAAGSGKTTVVESRVKYLVKYQGVNEESILVLAYNKSVAREVKEHLNNAGLDSVQVKTFHALGLEIYSTIEGQPKELSELADPDSPSAIYRFVTQSLLKQLNDPSNADIISALTLYLQVPLNEANLAYLPADEQNYHRRKVLSPLGLNGKRVKSFGEFLIAENLYLNQVTFAYEAQYPFINTRYRPDFTLLRPREIKPRTYLEYFGTDRAGNTRHDIPKEAYNRQIFWKKNIHKKFRTQMLELYYYHFRELGVQGFSEKLLGMVRAEGFQTQPLNRSIITKELEFKRIPKLVDLIVIFLRLFKGSRLSIDDLILRAKEGGADTATRERSIAFLRVFHLVFKEYESALEAEGKIDFEDMIEKSSEAIERGRWNGDLTHILVDEFQDISPQRAHLVKTIQSRLPGIRIFAVGDDFQSIYRFAGSQIQIMTQFGREFGFHKQLSLTLTHRFPQCQAEATNEFILRNPNQIRKIVKANRTSIAPPFVMIRAEESEHTAVLDRILSEIHDLSEKKQASVLLLGRYNSDEPSQFDSLGRQFPNLSVRFSTIHRAKGAEADFAVLLNLKGGTKGFPTGVHDDPLMDLILSGTDYFPNAEERRLMYVAMTRAKRRTYLIATPGLESDFARELLSQDYANWVEEPVWGKPKESPIQCPRCKSGRLVRREGKLGPFLGCTNYPSCPETRETTAVKFSSTSHVGVGASEGALRCPKCGNGILVRRIGKYGPFLGCTNFPSCKATKDISGDLFVGGATRKLPAQDPSFRPGAGEQPRVQTGPEKVRATPPIPVQPKLPPTPLPAVIPPTASATDRTYEDCPACHGTGGLNVSYGSSEAGCCGRCGGRGWID